MELPLADKLFSSTEVCEILGVSLRTLYRYIESGDIDSVQTPTGRHRFTKKHMEDFLGKGKRVRIPAEKVLREPAVVESVLNEEPVAEEKSEGLSLAEEGKEVEAEPEPELKLGQEELVEDVKEIYYKAGDLDVRSLAKKIKEVAERQNLKYAFTGLGGLSLHYPIKPFSNLEVYIDRDLLDLWIKELTLVETLKLTANLKIRFDNESLFSAEPLGGLMVANTDVLARDLRNEGYDELAQELKDRGA